MTNRVEGFDEAAVTLADLSKYMATKISKRSLTAGAEILMEEAVATAPVASGNYKDSYSIDQSPSRKRANVEVHVRADDKGAAAIEYGTTDTPAFGTFRRAADNLADRMIDAVSERLAREIESVAKK